MMNVNTSINSFFFGSHIRNIHMIQFYFDASTYIYTNDYNSYLRHANQRNIFPRHLLHWKSQMCTIGNYRSNTMFRSMYILHKFYDVITEQKKERNGKKCQELCMTKQFENKLEKKTIYRVIYFTFSKHCCLIEF